MPTWLRPTSNWGLTSASSSLRGARTPNTAGIFALGAAIDLLLEIGIDPIAGRVLALTDRLVRGLGARGAELLGPRGEEASGIVSFRLPDEPIDLIDTAGVPVLKRVLPVAAAVLAVVLFVVLRRRRQR